MSTATVVVVFPSREQIESADHEQLARWFRFLPEAISSTQLTLINRIVDRLHALGGMKPEISKRIGWVNA